MTSFTESNESILPIDDLSSLKPENILLDKEGYVRLTDFGLSRVDVVSKRGARSFCGTPEYLAPEVLAGHGHGKAVDWWALGILLHEMLYGLPPFYGSSRDEIFRKIRFEAPPRQAGYLSSSCDDLIGRLLSKNPEERLGSGPLGGAEIKQHPWFHSIDWGMYFRKEVQAPFTPCLQSDLDLSNFSSDFTNLPLESSKFMLDPREMNYPDFDGILIVPSSCR
jgi:serine/threonine protein kinase